VSGTPAADETRAPYVFSVTELTARIHAALETGFGLLWVEGEVSDLRRPPSGHLYFTLKDAHSQIAAVMFRRAAERVPFVFEDGIHLVVRGRLGLYATRGNLQLYADAVEPRGLGARQLAFEQLKTRLAAEGLFAAGRKRPLPFLPRRVGVVTALGGAAIHDILVTLARRCPGVDVRIRPVRVQGVGAAEEIAEALADLNAFGGVDVIIVGRGGGSVEDLWAFNEERVARAIVASVVPVVSAVGHEVDVTIADFVADARAPTPTAAAQLVVPDRSDLVAVVAGRAAALRAALGRRLDVERAEIRRLARHLDQLAPWRRLESLRERVGGLARRLSLAVRSAVERQRGRLGRAVARMDSLSPLAVLERGYTLVWRDRDGSLVRDADTLGDGERLRLRFARGEAHARVERSRR
jgi:exodeoxyribonuclease VII large subunit